MGLISSILGGTTQVQFIVNNNAVITVDASMKEEHSRESSPTEHPLENGDSISDHVVVKPFELSLTGIISDTPLPSGVAGALTEVATTVTSALLPPIGVVAGAAGYAFYSALAKSEKPSVVNYVQLLALQANAQPFDVITSLYRYNSMWIKHISVPRDADMGRVLMFTVSLRQLILVTSKTVNVQIFANPLLSANLADLGKQNANSDFQQGYTHEGSALTAAHGPIAEFP